jgi:TonB family protein
MKRNLSPMGVVALLLALSPLPAAARAAQQERPEPPKIIRKAGGVLQGSATRRVEPAYPPLAKTAQVSGAVVVEVTVDEEGNVISARAISGHPLLKDSAVNAARGWKFTPTQLSGVPVKVIGTITFNFALDYSKDIEKLQQKIAEHPDDPEPYDALAWAYLKAGQYEKALEVAQQALAVKSDYARAWFTVGWAYERLSRVDDAATAYRRSVELAPDSEDSFLALRMIGLLFFNNQRYQEAVEAFKQALAKRPQVDTNRMMLGLAYLKLGDKESAMEQLRILQEKHSSSADELMKKINEQQ